MQDLAVLDPLQKHPAKLHPLSRAGEAQKLSVMGRRHAKDERRTIALGKDLRRTTSRISSGVISPPR